MDTVHNRFGDFKVTFGSLVDAEEKGSHVISPAWRPTGVRNVGGGVNTSVLCTSKQKELRRSKEGAQGDA